MVSRRRVVAAIAASAAVAGSGCLETIGASDSDPAGSSPESDESNPVDSEESNSEDSDDASTKTVNAGVSIQGQEDGTVSVTFTSSGNADKILIRGDCEFEPDTLETVGEMASQQCASGDVVTVIATNDSGGKTTVATHTV